MKKIKNIKAKKPYFVAEISANHGGKISNAKKLIFDAKRYGADAVKLQTYQPETMTLNSNKKYFKIKSGLWKGHTLWSLYEKAHTPFSWHNELFNYAKKIGITCFSSAFDETAVDLLEKINNPIYKIASFEMDDFPLIKYISKTKKPVIISTGLASLNEIKKTYNYAKKCGIKDITLLYCVSSYPANNDEFNLNNIKILKDKLKCKIGFSDHSNNNSIASTAVVLGAEIIEKHIALPNDNTSPDVKFSLKGKEINKFRQSIDLAQKICGEKSFIRKKSEFKNLKFKRSIFCIKDILKGEKFSIKNIKRIRPGYGVSASEFEKILGKKSKKKIIAGEPIKKKVY